MNPINTYIDKDLKIRLLTKELSLIKPEWNYYQGTPSDEFIEADKRYHENIQRIKDTSLEFEDQERARLIICQTSNYLDKSEFGCISFFDKRYKPDTFLYVPWGETEEIEKIVIPPIVNYPTYKTFIRFKDVPQYKPEWREPDLKVIDNAIATTTPQAETQEELWAEVKRFCIDHNFGKRANHQQVITDWEIEFLIEFEKTIESNFTIHRKTK